MAIKFEKVAEKSKSKSNNQTRGGKRAGAGRKPKAGKQPRTSLSDLTGASAARDPETGRFLPGNRFWEVRSSCGPNPKFDDPETLWQACCEYFAWCEANPLYEDSIIAFQGKASHVPVPKMRAFTQVGLCMFIGVSQSAWNEWRRTRPDLTEVVTRADDVIYRQKFEGASAGLLIPNIIARDLGLADKREFKGDVTVKDERPRDEIEAGIESKLAGIASRGGEKPVSQKPDA